MVVSHWMPTATSCANCDIMFNILHKINPFRPRSCPDASDVMLIFPLMFFLWPCNYYDDSNYYNGNNNTYLIGLTLMKWSLSIYNNLYFSCMCLPQEGTWDQCLDDYWKNMVRELFFILRGSYWEILIEAKVQIPNWKHNIVLAMLMSSSVQEK